RFDGPRGATLSARPRGDARRDEARFGEDTVVMVKRLRRLLAGGVLLAAGLGALSGVTAGAAPPPAGARCPLTAGDGGDPFYKPIAPVRKVVGHGFELTGVVC